MKSVGIAGLPGAGASTVYTALTGMEPSTTGGKAAQAAVPVPDERVDRLAEISSSKKKVYSQLKFVETSSRVRSGGREGAGKLPAELLGYLRDSDALLLVVKAFDGADPAAELAELSLELTIADLDVLGGKLQRAEKEARLTGNATAKRVVPILERAKAALEDGTALRDLDWTIDERRDLGELSPITLKPAVVVASVPEEDAPAVPDGVIPVAARLEAEVAGMDPAEAAELLAGFGYETRGLDQVIRAVYDRLGLLTFLTTGDTESRAWECRAGAPAPEAAGVIHSDIQRGFIRAEVCSYDDVVKAGGWDEAKKQNLVRQEGKAYVMQEGDVVEFRFAV